MRKLMVAGALLLSMMSVLGTTAGAHAEEVVVKLWARADRSGPVARRQHRGRGRAAQRGAEGRRQRQDRQGRRSSKGRPPATTPTRSTSSRPSRSTRVRTSTSPRTSGSASSPSPATPWTWSSSSRPIRGPSPTSSRSCGTRPSIKGKIYAIPQDSEIRMFFYNKDMLRKIGKDEAFIEGLPAQVDKGRVHDGRTCRRSPRRWSTRARAQIGIIHRPNAGPDYLMEFASFGVKFVDPQTGQAAAAQGGDQAGARVVRLERAERRDAARTTPPCRGTRSRARSRPRRRSSTIRASGR